MHRLHAKVGAVLCLIVIVTTGDAGRCPSSVDFYECTVIVKFQLKAV